MGSTRKRKAKQADFSKPKLKVGKTKAKPTNYTDVSFKAKSIVIASQSIHRSQDPEYIVAHQLAMLKHHASNTRRDALGFLTTHLPPVGQLSLVVQRASPLILDMSSQVRSSLLKLFSVIPQLSASAHTKGLLLFTQSAMTHISPEIRADSTKFLEWLLDTCGDELMRNGWNRTLDCFLSLFGWGRDKSNTAIYGAEKRKNIIKHLDVFSKFVKAGLEQKSDIDDIKFHPDTNKHTLPTVSSPYAHLSLFALSGTPVITNSPQDRRDSLGEYREGILRGLAELQKEGGNQGRICKGIVTMIG